MNGERLLEHYERLADAPGAIARLRSFILDLAVRGLLLPQEASDEAIGRCYYEGSTSLEPPFDIPENWKWARLSSLGRLKGGGTPSKARDEHWNGDVPWVSPKDMKVDFISGAQMSITEAAIESSACQLIAASSVIFVVRGMILAHSFPVAVTRVPVAINQDMKALELANPAMARFVLLSLKGLKPLMLMMVQRSTHGTCRLEASDYTDFLIPVPPLAEQDRIVAKVDELMALCDRLEVARARREAARDAMTTATFARLDVPSLDPVSYAGHTRYTIESLEALTTRPDQVKRLRQTIINLAVHGKLVRQEPTDEPVRFVSPADAKQIGPVPREWRHARLAELLVEDTRNGYSRKPDDAPDGTPILRISSGTVRSDGVVSEEEHKLISGITPEVRSQYGLRRGDLLACRFNGNKTFVGRFTIFTDYLGIAPIYPDKLIRIRVDPRVAIPEFLRLASAADVVRAEIEAFCATTVGNWGISATNLKDVIFPVPPLGEQHRIVAKVDELMVLLSQLEAGMDMRTEIRSRLLDALLAEALTTADPEAALAIR